MKLVDAGIVVLSVLITAVVTRPMLSDVVASRAADERLRDNYSYSAVLDRRALTILPSNAKAEAQLVRLERERGDEQGAVRDGMAWHGRFGFNADVDAERAKALFRMGRYRDVAAVMGPVVESGKESAIDVLFAVYANRDIGRPAEGRRLALAALSQFPKDERIAAYALRVR